jgi:hypothetical protein
MAPIRAKIRAAERPSSQVDKFDHIRVRTPAGAVLAHLQGRVVAAHPSDHEADIRSRMRLKERSVHIPCVGAPFLFTWLR